MKIKSLFFEIILNSSLKEKSFSVKDINEYCNELLLKSPSFISKHCEGNPGGYSEYFKRVGRGIYVINQTYINQYYLIST